MWERAAIPDTSGIIDNPATFTFASRDACARNVRIMRGSAAGNYLDGEGAPRRRAMERPMSPSCWLLRLLWATGRKSVFSRSTCSRLRLQNADAAAMKASGSDGSGMRRSPGSMVCQRSSSFRCSDFRPLTRSASYSDWRISRGNRSCSSSSWCWRALLEK